MDNGSRRRWLSLACVALMAYVTVGVHLLHPLVHHLRPPRAVAADGAPRLEAGRGDDSLTCPVCHMLPHLKAPRSAPADGDMAETALGRVTPRPARLTLPAAAPCPGSRAPPA